MVNKDVTQLSFTSATSLAAAIRRRELSPVELVDALLEQIQRVNPQVNAFTVVLPDEARAAAREAEKAVMSGEALGVLHGVPITIKDTKSTRGVRTTYGSRAFAAHVPEVNALCVDRLLGAGAILLGKTTVPEFGMKGVTDSPLTGTTNNPWKLSHTVGGSSGGAAAAVAAGMCPVAQGGDWGGSIRIPASCCGVVGFKPSFGRIPIYEPPAANYHTIGHDGPIARTVADIALTLNAWAGGDSRDPFSLDSSHVDFLAAIANHSIAGLKVAYSRDLGLGPVSHDVSEKVEQAVRVFSGELGVEVDEATPALPDMQDSFLNYWRCLALQILTDELLPRIDVADVDPCLVDLAEQGRRVSAMDLMQALYVDRGKVYDALNTFFSSYDLLLTPTIAVPPFAHTGSAPGPSEINGQPINSLLGWLRTYPFNTSGHPAISVPCGFSPEGLPIGLQIVGRRHQDVSVLRAAAAYEEATRWTDQHPPMTV